MKTFAEYIHENDHDDPQIEIQENWNLLRTGSAVVLFAKQKKLLKELSREKNVNTKIETATELIEIQARLLLLLSTKLYKNK